MEQEDKNICPITLDPITVPGITCFGSIYEYDAIKRWLTNSSVDPRTNLHLPSKFVVKWTDFSTLREQAIQIQKSTELWCKYYDYFDSIKCSLLIHKLKISKSLKQERINQLQPLLDTPEKIKDYARECYMKKIRMESENPNEHQDFQYLTLRNMSLNKVNFKACHFELSTLEHMRFYDCGFSRVSFAGSHFVNVVFVNCEFNGEEFNMRHATGNIIIHNCSTEHYNWKPITSPLEVCEVLKKERGFEGEILILTG